MFKTVPSLQARPHIERRNLEHTSSFLPGSPNTVNEGNPATLSSPYTHPSSLGIKGPLTSGSEKPPARPPNLRGKERSLHLTNSGQRLQWRSYRCCARNTPRMKYPHFFPLHCRRHSKPDDKRCTKSGFITQCIPHFLAFTIHIQGEKTTQGPIQTSSHHRTVPVQISQYIHP